VSEDAPSRREAEKIALPSYPSAAQYRSWIILAKQAVDIAAARSDDAATDCIERGFLTTETSYTLRTVEKKFIWLDRKLAHALLSMTKDDMSRDILT
jgi:hypothetical protein